ncbi:MAG: hypothetical protein ACTSPB_07720 [Candidatus Thorarchaeota archaeon]
MTKEKIPTKWDFIANWLKKLNAPKKVINAAIAIDDALDSLGLGYNTEKWEEDYDDILQLDRTRLSLLYDLVLTDDYCIACDDCCLICRRCKLGTRFACTPRSKHADQYFTIVRKWAQKG